MAATYEQLIAKARELDAAGDTEGAKRLAKIAISRRGQEAERGFNAEGFKRDMLADQIGPSQAAIQGAAQGVSFGASDEIFGGVNGALEAISGDDRGYSVMDGDPGLMGRMKNRFSEGYDEARDDSRAILDVAREDHPVAAYGGELAGAVAAPGMMLKGAGKANAWSRAGQAAAVGGIEGAGYGFNAGEGGLENRAKNAAQTALIGGGMGAAMTPAATALTKILEARLLNKATKQMIKAAPDSGDLKRQAGNLYREVKRGGQVASPDEVGSLATELGARLQKEGVILPSGKPMKGYQKAMGPIETLGELAETGLDGRQVGAVKELFQDAASHPKKSKARVGQIALNEFDDFVRAKAPKRAEADKLYSSAKKVDQVEELLNLADVEGTPNALQTQFKKLSRKEVRDQLPGWSGDEIAAVQRVVKGGPIEQGLRTIGKRAPSSLSGAMLTGSGPTIAGSLAGSPVLGAVVGAGVVGAGVGSRAIANAAQRKNANIAKALIATGGKMPDPKVDALRMLIVEKLMGRGASRSGIALSQ